MQTWVLVIMIWQDYDEDACLGSLFCLQYSVDEEMQLGNIMRAAPFFPPPIWEKAVVSL